MYARDVLPTPDQKPSHARAANIHGTLWARAVARKPEATPAVAMVKMRRRPILSEA